MNKLNMSHEELNRELTTYNGDYTLAQRMRFVATLADQTETEVADG